MAKANVLIIFGNCSSETKLSIIQKSLCDGLLSALGHLKPDLDAQLASLTIAAPEKTEEFGTAVTHNLGSDAQLRLLLLPKLSQFRAAFNDAIHSAYTAGPGSTVAVVYVGRVLHTTGDWVLGDSTFSGVQLKLWLDCEATVTWQPEIPKLMPAQTGVDPLRLCVCTPVAGIKTVWPLPKSPLGGHIFTTLSKSRKLTVQLFTSASWRANGKLVAIQASSSEFEGLLAFSKDAAELNKRFHESMMLSGNENLSLMPHSFKTAPPSVYLLPSGRGGVLTQAAGLFAIEGVNVLLGSGFAREQQPPQWWELVKNLNRLDVAFIPDWSAASIQSYDFFTRLLTENRDEATAWLGQLMLPAGLDSSTDIGPVVFSPPLTSAGSVEHQIVWSPQSITATAGEKLPDRIRLFYKIGLGELVMQPLATHSGAVLMWKFANPNIAPLRIFMPADHLAGPHLGAPVQALGHLLKLLRRVHELASPMGADVSTTTATGATTTRPSNKSSSVASISVKIPNGSLKLTTPQKPTATSRPTVAQATPRRPATTTTVKSETALQVAKSKQTVKTTPVPKTTPSRLASGTTKTPLSQPSPPRTNVRPINETLVTHSKPGTTAKAPVAKFSRPSSTPTAKTTPGSKPTGPISKTTPVKKIAPTKTEVKLNAHAAKVAASSVKAPSPSGHVLKFNSSGCPTNLPPRRKIGEKTVMEELAEIPTTTADGSPQNSSSTTAEETDSIATSTSLPKDELVLTENDKEKEIKILDTMHDASQPETLVLQASEIDADSLQGDVKQFDRDESLHPFEPPMGLSPNTLDEGELGIPFQQESSFGTHDEPAQELEGFGKTSHGVLNLDNLAKLSKHEMDFSADHLPAHEAEHPITSSFESSNEREEELATGDRHLDDVAYSMLSSPKAFSQDSFGKPTELEEEQENRYGVGDRPTKPPQDFSHDDFVKPTECKEEFATYREPSHDFDGSLMASTQAFKQDELDESTQLEVGISTPSEPETMSKEQLMMPTQAFAGDDLVTKHEPTNEEEGVSLKSGDRDEDFGHEPDNQSISLQRSNQDEFVRSFTHDQQFSTPEESTRDECPRAVGQDVFRIPIKQEEPVHQKVCEQVLDGLSVESPETFTHVDLVRSTENEQEFVTHDRPQDDAEYQKMLSPQFCDQDALEKFNEHEDTVTHQVLSHKTDDQFMMPPQVPCQEDSGNLIEQEKVATHQEPAYGDEHLPGAFGNNAFDESLDHNEELDTDQELKHKLEGRLVISPQSFGQDDFINPNEHKQEFATFHELTHSAEYPIISPPQACMQEFPVPIEHEEHFDHQKDTTHEVGDQLMRSPGAFSHDLAENGEYKEKLDTHNQLSGDVVYPMMSSPQAYDQDTFEKPSEREEELATQQEFAREVEDLSMRSPQAFIDDDFVKSIKHEENFSSHHEIVQDAEDLLIASSEAFGQKTFEKPSAQEEAFDDHLKLVLEAENQSTGLPNSFRNDDLVKPIEHEDDVVTHHEATHDAVDVFMLSPQAFSQDTLEKPSTQEVFGDRLKPELEAEVQPTGSPNSIRIDDLVKSTEHEDDFVTHHEATHDPVDAFMPSSQAFSQDTFEKSISHEELFDTQKELLPEAGDQFPAFEHDYSIRPTEYEQDFVASQKPVASVENPLMTSPCILGQEDSVRSVKDDLEFGRLGPVHSEEHPDYSTMTLPRDHAMHPCADSDYTTNPSSYDTLESETLKQETAENEVTDVTDIGAMQHASSGHYVLELQAEHSVPSIPKSQGLPISDEKVPFSDLPDNAFEAHSSNNPFKLKQFHDLHFSEHAESGQCDESHSITEPFVASRNVGNVLGEFHASTEHEGSSLLGDDGVHETIDFESASTAQMPPIHAERHFMVHTGLPDVQEDIDFSEDQLTLQQPSEMNESDVNKSEIDHDGRTLQHHLAAPYIDKLEYSEAHDEPATGRFLADSTTESATAIANYSRVGFIDLPQTEAPSNDFAQSELSPTSDASHDSVVHHPAAAGFKLDLVSSSSGDILQASDIDSPANLAPMNRSGAEFPQEYLPIERQQHAMPFAGHAEESLRFESSYDRQHSNGFSQETIRNGIPFTEDTSMPSIPKTMDPFVRAALSPSATKMSAPFEGEEEEVHFDHMKAWDSPQGMPAPNPPQTKLAGAVGTPVKMATVAKTPETLPLGSPVYLDLVWVPGYIVRVPFDIATAFFTQVRARCYVLSGESLHPITGEAIIAGVSKWSIQEREIVEKMAANGISGINIVPTDEPLEWVKWLRSNGGSTTVNETGEQRLGAVGIDVKPSATLCDIHFSDGGVELNCQGTEVRL